MRARRWRVHGGGGRVGRMPSASRPPRAATTMTMPGRPARPPRRPASDLEVGLVSDVGKFNDRSFNQSALEGLEQAEAELGVQGTPDRVGGGQRLHPQPQRPSPGTTPTSPSAGLPDGRRHEHGRQPVPGQQLRDHRLPAGGAEGQAGQRARPHLRDQREQLPDRLHGGEGGPGAGRQAGHQRGRRPGDPDRDDLPRRATRRARRPPTRTSRC